MEKYHIPVLQKEVLEYLNPKPNDNFIDCTIGEGGHALVILEKTAPQGKILGIDWEVRIKAKDKRLVLVQDNFANLKKIVKKQKFKKVTGILFDLGMSSWHLEESGRGFTFKKAEPLDMRYSKLSKLTAEKIVNYFSRFEIEKILQEYGQEKKAHQLSERIVRARAFVPFKTTAQLVKITEELSIHPQRTFQALRIAVNDELNNLKKVLPQTIDILKKRGRVAVISFHSLEDGMVKNFFREKSKQNLMKILTKKPITPSGKEVKSNPRSRSAKLRIAEKI